MLIVNQNDEMTREQQKRCKILAFRVSLWPLMRIMWRINQKFLTLSLTLVRFIGICLNFCRDFFSICLFFFAFFVFCFCCAIVLLLFFFNIWLFFGFFSGFLVFGFSFLVFFWFFFLVFCFWFFVFFFVFVLGFFFGGSVFIFSGFKDCWRIFQSLIPVSSLDKNFDFFFLNSSESTSGATRSSNAATTISGIRASSVRLLDSCCILVFFSLFFSVPDQLKSILEVKRKSRQKEIFPKKGKIQTV